MKTMKTHLQELIQQGAISPFDVSDYLENLE